MSGATEEQKKKLYDSLPQEQKEKQTYTEWVKEAYNNQYNKWVPWLEDQYLALFGKDNKASYVTKDTLDKSKVTGISQVDTLQDGVHGIVAGQVGKGGLAQPLGDMASKEGINRAERGGKDEKGTYGGPMAGVTDPIAEKGGSAGSGVAAGAQTAGSSVLEGAKSAGGYFGGMFGAGGKKEEGK